MNENEKKEGRKEGRKKRKKCTRRNEQDEGEVEN